MKYRPDIDGLRGLAIAFVVVFHLFPQQAPGGFIGVDVFFVISGFLITSIIFNEIGRNVFDIYIFYWRRIRRIFPALILVLLTTLLIGWFALWPKDFQKLAQATIFSSIFVQNLSLWRESGYFDTASETKPLMHLWSLSIEEQFYLIYPALLILANRFKVSPGMAIGALALISFGLNVTMIDSDPVGAFFLPQTRFWELLAGGWLAVRALSQPKDALSRFGNARSKQWLSLAASLVGLGGIVGSGFCLASNMAFPGWWALLPVASTVLVLSAGPSTFFNRHILANRGMIWLGLISYPLYLWHWPLLSLARIVEAGPLSPATRVAIAGLSVLLAWITYRLIERPLRTTRSPARPAFVSMAMMALVATAASIVFSTNGAAFRLPPDLRPIATYKYDYTKDARVECWMRAGQKNDFAPSCTDALKPDDRNRPRVLVWGDSHAARLFPGLLLRFGEQAEMAPLNRDGCAPILGIGYDNCKNSNEYILSLIEQYKPDAVIMFAVWNVYNENWNDQLHNDRFYSALKDTIRSIRAAGVEDILLVGPNPQWLGALPDTVLKYAWDNDEVPPPLYMSYGLNPVIRTVDLKMKEFVASMSVEYFSLVDLLCNPQGCRTRATSEPASFMSWDYGHLTTDGALYVASRLPQRFFEARERAQIGTSGSVGQRN